MCSKGFMYYLNVPITNAECKFVIATLIIERLVYI